MDLLQRGFAASKNPVGAPTGTECAPTEERSLVLKLEDNPPVLPPGIQAPAQIEGTWWVAHTKSRFEKVFAWDLLRRGIGYYLPLIERVRISGGKRRKVLAPLFSSYVFFCGGEEARYAAMTTDRLCQTIAIPDQGQFLSQIDAVHRAMAGKAQLDPYPFLAAGQRCRITTGPFMGIEGTVISRERTARIVLEVSILGQAVVMEIDPSLLEAA
jgi:transcription termination/antitermination protein NusG